MPQSNEVATTGVFRSSVASAAAPQDIDALYKKCPALAKKEQHIVSLVHHEFRSAVLVHHLVVWQSIHALRSKKEDVARAIEVGESSASDAYQAFKHDIVAVNDTLKQSVAKADGAQPAVLALLRTCYGDLLSTCVGDKRINADETRMFREFTSDRPAQIERLIKLAKFNTSVFAKILKVDLDSRDLICSNGKMAEDASTHQLQPLINRLSELLKSLRERRHSLTDIPQSLMRHFGFQEILDTEWGAINLLEKFLQAARAKSLGLYLRKMREAADPSEAFLDTAEADLSEVVGYAAQTLILSRDTVALMHALIKLSASGRSDCRAEINRGTARQAAAIHSIANAQHTMWLKRVARVVRDDLAGEEFASLGRMYDRTKRLMLDVLSCYASASTGVEFASASKGRHAGAETSPLLKPLNAKIRLPVMALVANAVADLITDLERTEMEVETSKGVVDDNTLTSVRLLCDCVARLEQHLTDHIDSAMRALPKEFRGKAHELRSAETRMREARQYAGEHLASFKVERSEATWSEVESDETVGRREQSAHAQAPDTQRYAALTQRNAQGTTQELAAISRRLNEVEEGGYSATFDADSGHAERVVLKMRAELATVSLKPMSAYEIWRRVALEAAKFEAMAARVERSIESLAHDLDYLGEHEQNETRADSLTTRAATAKGGLEGLRSLLRDKAVELAEQAETMSFARRKAMFIQKPTAAAYEIMRGNGCIGKVHKRPTRFPTTRENDYVQEYVIYLDEAQDVLLRKKDKETGEVRVQRAKERRVVVHVHYNGQNPDAAPTSCHFKTWDQRFDGNDRKGGKEGERVTVHYDELYNAEMARKLIAELDELAQRPLRAAD